MTSEPSPVSTLSRPKPLTTGKTLATAAASTGALFALQHHADAAIVYSGITNIPVFTSNQATIAMRSGRFDVYVANIGYRGYARASAIFPAALLANNSANIKRLASGSVIGARAATGALNSFRARGDFLLASTGGGRDGTWLPGQTGFAGVRVLTTGGVNSRYGWIKMRVDVDGAGIPSLLTILGYAYEDTLNTSIVAAQTTSSSVPEPSRALLALAGLGAAALRRRRK